MSVRQIRDEAQFQYRGTGEQIPVSGLGNPAIPDWLSPSNWT